MNRILFVPVLLLACQTDDPATKDDTDPPDTDVVAPDDTDVDTDPVTGDDTDWRTASTDVMRRRPSGPSTTAHRTQSVSRRRVMPGSAVTFS